MRLQKHTELDVYKKAYDVAMQIFATTKTFPKEETYSLTDQIRRSSRSGCANLAEARRKAQIRRGLYRKAVRRGKRGG